MMNMFYHVIIINQLLFGIFKKILIKNILYKINIMIIFKIHYFYLISLIIIIFYYHLIIIKNIINYMNLKKNLNVLKIFMEQISISLIISFLGFIKINIILQIVVIKEFSINNIFEDENYANLSMDGEASHCWSYIFNDNYLCIRSMYIKP